MRNSLSKFEAISLIVLITVTQIILNMPEYLINITGTGAIVNIIYIGIIGIVFCFIIYKLFKNFPNFDILDLAEFIGGRFLKFLVSTIFILFFLFSTALAISDFVYLIKSLYFNNYSNLFIIIFFLIVIIVSNLRGFGAIKKIICVFIPFSVLSILCLGFGISDTFDANNFSPIFGYNYESTFILGLQNIFILNFIWIYFFMLPSLKKKNDFKPIIFTSFIINIFLIVLSIIVMLSLFPALAQKTLANSNNLSTIYLITRRIKINSFIEQTDILFLFIWVLSLFGYISFLVYSLSHVLNKLFNFENKSSTVLPIVSIILGICLIVNKFNIIKFLENTVFKYFSIILILICFFILILGNLKRRRKQVKSYDTKT